MANKTAKNVENPVYDSAFSMPKIEDNSMISVVYDEETGEILDNSPRPSLLPRSYISEPNRKFEDCDPTPCAFALENKPPMDIREMLIKFGYDRVAQPVDATPFDETQISLADDDGLDSDDEAFNNAMASRPCAVGDDGLTNLERELVKQGEDVESFREWQGLKDNPAFKQFLSMSEEEQNKMIASLSQPLSDSVGTQPEPEKV